VETLNSIKPETATRHTVCIALTLSDFTSPILNAQTESGFATEALGSSTQRPKTTDKASEQLIHDYLTVTGGKSARRRI
jgi:hypothetical protein